jgi:hypothetical protein
MSHDEINMVARVVDIECYRRKRGNHEFECHIRLSRRSQIGGLKSLEDDAELQRLKKMVRSQAFACDGGSVNVRVSRGNSDKLRIVITNHLGAL